MLHGHGKNVHILYLSQPVQLNRSLMHCIQYTAITLMLQVTCTENVVAVVVLRKLWEQLAISIACMLRKVRFGAADKSCAHCRDPPG